MAIKPLQPRMAKEVAADGTFRSLQDVQTHLEGIQTHIDELDGLIKQYQLQFSRVQPQVKAATQVFEIDTESPKGPRKPRPKGGKSFNLDKIDKIVIPKMDVLRQNFGIADELSEQVDELDKLYNSVAVNFRGVRGSAEMLKAIKTTQTGAEMKLDKALKFLGEIGERHTPTGFKTLIEETISIVSPELTFQNHKTFMYGYETKETNLAFSVYIELNGLQDDEGSVYPKFYFVFTCILKGLPKEEKVEPVYYVTVMHEFAAPGKYGLGKKISSPTEAANTLGLMMEMENISTAIGTKPHNLDPDKIKKGQFRTAARIGSIRVEPNALIFCLVKAVRSRKEVNEITKSLFIDVKGLLSRIKGAKIKVKIDAAATGFEISFTLTNLARGDEVNVHDIDFLKEQFGLDDTKLRKVIKIINDETES